MNNAMISKKLFLLVVIIIFIVNIINSQVSEYEEQYITHPEIWKIGNKNVNILGTVITGRTLLAVHVKVDNKIAFVGTLFLLFQIATLRQSWDRFRTILALMFFFATLTALKSNYKFKWPVVGFLTILTVLSRDYVAVVLFITVLGSRILTRKNVFKPMLTLIPGLILFSLLYLQIFWEGYLSPQNPFIIRDYFWAVQDIISISVIYYCPLLFFAIKGWKNRERLFDPLIIWLIISSISVIFINFS